MSTDRGTLTSGVLFGSLAVVFLMFTVRNLAGGVAWSPTGKRSSRLACTRESVVLLLAKSSEFALILAFAYVAEHHPPYPHSEKVYDRDLFFMLTALLLLVSSFTIKPNTVIDVAPVRESEAQLGSTDEERRKKDKVAMTEQKKVPDSSILNRDQTEEWKGWMQFMFLLYHYYHAEETYNAIRIMITCYVWMTGFGNFSFFYIKRDFSTVRVLQMLWRLNFLVLFLCLTQGNTYILYYICPLHTFFFFMVYAVMRFARGMNHSKYKIRIKLMCLAFIIFLVWDVDLGLFECLHFFLGTTPKVGATAGELWEWYFRTTLDHWSTFFGIIFAANYPITSLWMKKVEEMPTIRQWMVKMTVAVPLFLAFAWWVTGPFSDEKLEYNLTNAYYGFIPLITYIFYRNIHPTLRSYSLDLLHTIGKTTLETYLLQHHIWLTSNAKSLLTLIPGWPKCNMLFVTALYFFVSRRAYSITMYLRGMLLPNDLGFCLRSLGAMATAIFCSFVIASMLLSSGGGEVHFGSLVFVCLFLGVIVDSILVQMIERSNHKNELETTVTSTPNSSRMRAVVAAFVVAVGFVGHAYAGIAASIVQPLESNCKAFACEGKWVVVDECQESTRAIAYHEHGVGAFASCNSLESWGWDNQPPSSFCRFSSRDSKALKKTLAGGRSVLFVGDSIIRNTFHAFARLIGADIDTQDEEPTDDEDTLKHANQEVAFGKTKLSFVWAPLASDLVEKLGDVSSNPDFVDFIVVGDGLWDCLHNHDKFESFEEDIMKVDALLNEIKSSRGSGIVWMAPTTINDERLLSEEKRVHLTESKVKVYRDAGLSIMDSRGAFDLIFDSSRLTKPKIEDSYDGVHYSEKIYDICVQIIIQSMDWGLPARGGLDDSTFTPNKPGKMANAKLGLMMLVICAIGLFTFDGYLGLAWVAGRLVGGPRTIDLWEEAFAPLHEKIGIESPRAAADEENVVLLSSIETKP